MWCLADLRFWSGIVVCLGFLSLLASLEGFEDSNVGKCDAIVVVDQDVRRSYSGVRYTAMMKGGESISQAVHPFT